MPVAAAADALVIAPDLVEEGVLQELGRLESQGDLDPAAEYRRQRDGIEDGDAGPEDRAAALTALHRSWFARFAFDGFLRERLEEIPGLAIPAGGARAVRASGDREEGADLHRLPGPGGGPGAFSIVLRIRDGSLGAPRRLRTRLRRDLLHVADMLDPEFGYDPDAGASLPPASRNLLRDRVSAIWGLTVAGRARRLWPEEDILPPDRAAVVLGRAFPALAAEEAGWLAEHFRGGPRPPFAEIVRRAAAGAGGS